MCVRYVQQSRGYLPMTVTGVWSFGMEKRECGKRSQEHVLK